MKEHRLIFLLSKAQHKLGVYLKKALSEQGVQVTGVQVGILFLLKQRAQTMTELSRELMIDNSAITGLVDRLERSGFVRREINPGDRRAFRISITEKGLAEVEAARHVVHRVNAEIQAGFSPEEVEAFKAVLNGMLTRFETPSVPN